MACRSPVPFNVQHTAVQTPRVSSLRPAAIQHGGTRLRVRRVAAAQCSSKKNELSLEGHLRWPFFFLKASAAEFFHGSLMKRQARGFSLLEVSIVLVFVGLLIGSILAAQELIAGARLRSLLQQQDGLKAAYYGFFNRYRALPGDYASATTNIREISGNCNGGNGNGNGRIEAANNENTLAWEHLARAGFLNVIYTCAAAAGPASSPMNPHGAPLELVFDANYAGPLVSARHNLKTGPQISSRLLSEMDRKVDDGNARDGTFRAQTGDRVSPPADCYDAAGAWRILVEGTNCGGLLLL
jgi:hypothetical protein